jgi:MYXO-CTERM domain-containing protein
VIAPTNTSATIYGSSNATVNSLVVGGSTGQLVTLDLNGGTTTTTNGTTLQANAVLAGIGRLAGNLTAQAGSTISVGGGQSMQLTGGTLTNGGTVSAIGTSANLALFSAGSTTLNQTTGKIQLQNANAAFTGTVTNSGQIQLQNANAAFTGTVTNSGLISLQNANTTFSGSINNSGQLVASFGNNNITGQVITLSGGKIILSGNSTNTFYDNVDIKSGGELRVSAGSSAVFFSLVNQRTGSTFSGTGSKAYEGGLSVGGSPGYGFDSGSVSFGDGNSYLAEIGGTTACTVACDTNDALKNSGFDKYQVVGKLTFGGELKLTSWLSFEAKLGQSFDLFDWGTTAGQFSSIDSSGLKLVAGTGLDYSKLYTDGVISVVAVPETETWAMLLAGLGVVGVWQRRRSLGACDESTV